MKKLAGGVCALCYLVLAWTALLPASGFAGDKPRHIDDGRRSR
jgi:hypothetical protein